MARGSAVGETDEVLSADNLIEPFPEGKGFFVLFMNAPSHGRCFLHRLIPYNLERGERIVSLFSTTFSAEYADTDACPDTNASGSGQTDDG